jgi:hypothetical protein
MSVHHRRQVTPLTRHREVRHISHPYLIARCHIELMDFIADAAEEAICAGTTVVQDRRAGFDAISRINLATLRLPMMAPSRFNT